MPLTIERATLVAALTAVNKAVEARNTYPILANVLLSGADDRLTVRGTDLDIEITTSVPANGGLHDTTAPAKMLLDIARKFPAGAEVTLELDEAMLLVKSGRSRFKVPVLDADNFPSLNAGAFTASFDADLAALFAPVAFAISTEETRYYLNGIFLHSTGDELRAVATDGHRMARSSSTSVGDIPAVIVPRKTVGIVPEGTVHVELSDTKLKVTKGETVIVSKLIEGTFPDYERVTPKNNDKAMTVDRQGMLASVDRVAVLASERGGKAIKLELAGGGLTLTVQGTDGTATDELLCEYESEPMTIGFNAGYLSDMLRTASGQNFTLVLGDSGGSALVKGDNDNWLGVLMPTRVA